MQQVSEISRSANSNVVQKIENSRASHPKSFAEMTSRELLKEINWVSAIFLVITPLLALFLVPFYVYSEGWSWELTVFLLVLYAISNLSITICYHRYFAHRSFDVPEWAQVLFLLIAAMAFQGSALRWSSDHRRHHRQVDTDEDPYTINKGFFHAHLGWMLFKDRHPDVDVIPRDLASNKWVQFQHKYYIPIASFMGFILPGILGSLFSFGFWPGVLIGGLTRIVLSQHSTFLINSAAHTFGNQPYTDKNSARDSFTMAILTFGEGYHNYHHYFQVDYRNGVRWYQWDPSKWLIALMAIAGVARRLKKVSKEEILKARIAMEEKRILARGANEERVRHLRERILAAQARWKSIQADFKRYKEDRNWSQVFIEKRAELELAQIEMNNALRAWKTYVRTWLRAQTA
jgi:stearoyl-CoA desaturase (delta-9 desaturase)